MEKVSVIIPCYNGEKFIDRSIKSVYIQEYPAIELIVVDDGSTDGSKEKILAWESNFKDKGFELKYIYQKNTGPGGAINKGLKYVTGDYISLLDADDEYLPGAVIEKVQYLQQNSDVDVVRSNGWMVKGNNKFLFINDEKEKAIEDVFLALLRGETNNWAGSYMVRAKALFDFYPDREIYQSRFGQNLQFLLPLTYKKRCGFIDKPHMNYILQENSLSQTQINRYEKDEINSHGYEDIYIHMLNQIVTDVNERAIYMNIFYASFYRSAMKRAIKYGNKSNIKNSFRKLKQTGYYTLNDLIDFYKVFCPFIRLILRCFRKGSYYLSLWKK